MLKETSALLGVDHLSRSPSRTAFRRAVGVGLLLTGAAFLVCRLHPPKPLSSVELDVEEIGPQNYSSSAAAWDPALNVSNLAFTTDPGSIGKNAWAASDPVKFLNWSLQNLPVMLADDTLPSQCGSFGRVALCRTTLCLKAFPGFGLHTVNAFKRPDAPLSVEHVERQFSSKFATGDFDAFMDYSVALWATDGLDAYARKFSADPDTRTLGIEWPGQDGQKKYYSLFVLAPSTQVVLELVSDTVPDQNATVWKSTSLVRVPARAFRGMNAMGSPSGTLTPLVVSKAVSDLDRASNFYERVLSAKPEGQTTNGESRANFYSFSQHGGANTLVRLVEHPPSKSHGMSVQDFEQGKLEAHQNAINGAYCGFDRWFDNHYGAACAHDSCKPMDMWRRNLDTYWTGNMSLAAPLYHIWRDPSYDMYAVDTTGDAIQLMSYWDSKPKSAEGNAADLCIQGACSSHDSA